MLLRATTTCTFSTAQLPKVLRTCDVFNMFTSKCASCHNGVQSFISAPATLASLLFDPPEPQNIGKTRCFTTFLFAHFDLLSSDSFSSLTSSLLTLSLLCLFPPLLLHLSILSEVCLLNFLRQLHCLLYVEIV